MSDLNVRTTKKNSLLKRIWTSHVGVIGILSGLSRKSGMQLQFIYSAVCNYNVEILTETKNRTVFRRNVVLRDDARPFTDRLWWVSIPLCGLPINGWSFCFVAFCQYDERAHTHIHSNKADNKNLFCTNQSDIHQFYSFACEFDTKHLLYMICQMNTKKRSSLKKINSVCV